MTFEYMLVSHSWDYHPHKPEPPRSDHNFFLRFPDGSTDERTAASWLAILNGLASDGWELVSEVVQATHYAERLDGWVGGAGLAHRWRYTLRRERSG